MLVRYEFARKEQFDIEKGKHRFNSLFITLSGEYEYTVGRTTKRIYPYQPIVFRKGESFRKRVIRPIEYVIISPADFSYDGDWLLSYEENDRLRMESSVKHLKRAISEKLPDAAIEHFFNDILLTACMRHPELQDASVRAAYEYMIQNLAQAMPLSYLAERCGCSVQTLISRFKRHYGKTPAKFMTELRISRAKELLLNTHDSVWQIAEVCGYENVYYFSNVFKRETGISPLRFRQGYRL